MMTLIHKAIRLLFITLDSMLAWAIGTIYELIVLIANVDIFGYYIFEFMDRVYAFLAVFMVFKLSISVVNYVLNPDQLVDKAKGFGKLIQQVIIVIILIISVPSIFEWAYDLQSVILNTNVLNTIVTGQKNGSDFDPTSIGKDGKEAEKVLKQSTKAAGNMIQYQLLRSFIYAEDGKGNNYAGVSGGQTCEASMENFASNTGGGDSEKYAYGVSCLTNLDTVNNTSGGTVRYWDEENKISTNTFEIVKDGSFTNRYQLGISTLCLGFTVYIFLTICFDVALRTVRLGVLQLMAPIPIISMLDPASGKSGMFSKWLKDCTKTYTSLFIRLLGVYFAIEIITALTRDGSFVWRGTDAPVNNIFVRVFVILGVLMFAKQLPQFIEGITGIKMDPGGLNLKKKLGGVPGLNKTLGAAKGLATGSIIGGIGAATGAGAGRGLAGAWQGMRAGMQGKKFNEIRKGQVDANNRMRNAIANGSTFGGRMEARARNFIGVETRGARMERTAKVLEAEKKFFDEQAKTRNDIRDRILSELESNAGVGSNGATWALERRRLLEAQANINTVEQSSQASINSAQQNLALARASGDSARIRAAQAALNAAEDKATRDMALAQNHLQAVKDASWKNIMNSGEATNDNAIQVMQEQYNIRNDQNGELASRINLTNIDLSVASSTNASDLSTARGNAMGESNRIGNDLYVQRTGTEAQAAAADQNAIS